MTSDFLSSISPGWVVMFLGLPSYGIYISQASCCTSVLNLHSKNLQIASKLFHRVTDITRFEKNLDILQVLLWAFIQIGEISLQEYASEGISHPVFYGDLVYKLRRVKCEANFFSSGSSIRKRLRRGQYDPLIIERTTGLIVQRIIAFIVHFLIKAWNLAQW